jgi:4'-phosphopantetheinyl transferase
MDDRLYWLTQTQADVPGHDKWLSEGELARLAGMRFPKRRNDWIMGRWTAKLAASAHCAGTLPSMNTIEIRAAVDGAPEVFLQGLPAPISISISHSRDRGFCVVGSKDLAVGCDLEFIEMGKDDDFFGDYFTPEEIAFCREAPAALQSLAGLLVWGAKESALKILREGLRRDTRSVRIQVDPWTAEDSWNTWTGRCTESSRVFYGWWRAYDGFVYTMASDRPTRTPEALHTVSGQDVNRTGPV